MLISKDILQNLYTKKELTAKQIGRIFGMDRHTICRQLKTHGLLRTKSEVETLQWGKRRKLPEPEQVRYLYWDKSLNIYDIGEMFGIAPSDVHSYIKRHNIPCRPNRGGGGGSLEYRPSSFLGKHHTEEANEKNRRAHSEAMLRGHYCTKPTKPEGILIRLIEEHHLPFKYVGDGQVVLGGKCPDFININGKKQVIEMFGTYWHPIFDVARKKEHYCQYGFDTLVIWEDELKNEETTLKKIQRFARKKAGAAG